MMVITKDNNTKENWLILLAEYRETRDRLKKDRQVYGKNVQLETLNIEPVWMEQARIERKQLAEIRKRQPKLKTLFKWVDENKLQYFKLSPWQHRIESPRTGKFVDWWDGKKNAMRRVDGSYGVQGKQQGFLLQELVKLL